MSLPTWADTVSGQLTIEFDLSDHDQGKDAQLWLPYPVSDDQQTISNINITGDHANSAVYTDNVSQTPMLHANWHQGTKKRTLTLQFDVKRREMIRREFPAEHFCSSN